MGVGGVGGQATATLWRAMEDAMVEKYYCSVGLFIAGVLFNVFLGPEPSSAAPSLLRPISSCLSRLLAWVAGLSMAYGS